MRIERVVARAFGPFRDEELRLAPGMTVIGGPNEAGKSSWHAALRLALTGVRRGKGPGTAAERQLADRHRPWDAPDRWEVEARIELADRRQIEIHQDLAGKVDCRAVDVGLGRDVSHEILDGTPDASRWLGLTRDAFAATVSVNQAQILAVTEAADQLQEQMQRAAASHGSDTTAAAAIGRLEQYRRDAVGVDRVGARGPLRTAKDRLAALEVRLGEVRRQHDEYLARALEVEEAERRLATARERVLLVEAQLAAGLAAQARARHREAAALAARHPEAPEAFSVRDERADGVAGALHAWQSRPEALLPDGRSAAELALELGVLPAAPDGDLEPDLGVREARRALDLAEDALALLDDEPDAVPDGVKENLPAVDERRVRELARRLRVPQLPGAAGLEDELRRAREAAATGSAGGWRPAALGSAALALTGLVLLALAQWLAAGALLGVAVLTALLAWRGGAAGRQAADRLARAEAAMAPYRQARELAEREGAAAATEARALELPADSVALDELADRLASAAADRRASAERAARRAALASRRDAAVAALRAALRDRGEPADGDVREAWAAYEAACRSRAAQSAAAARRHSLERELESRRALEQSAARARDACLEAERRLREAAASVGLAAGGDTEAVAEGLRTWQKERTARLRQNEAAIAEWQRLQALLDGHGLEEIAAVAEALEARARQLAVQLADPLPSEAAPPPALEARLVRERAALESERSAADELRGNLEARREALPDVAEVEEATEAARAELARVESLALTFETTLQLLRSAEERVHRSLAPVLARAIGRWLPIVCSGAYSEVSVDPADLAVRVKEALSGRWREARLLSEGTREQIYLLLRVAMAEHLVINGETAPLLLDEVTVQSDPERKRQLLDVLHRLSGERQVILFTHDDDVLQWAQAGLDPGRDALVRLESRHDADSAPAWAATAASPLAELGLGG